MLTRRESVVVVTTVVLLAVAPLYGGVVPATRAGGPAGQATDAETEVVAVDGKPMDIESQTIDFETLPGGGETEDAMGLASEYRESYGVRFEPQGGSDHGAIFVDCTENRFCAGARSGSMAITGADRTEFRRHPIVVEFDEPKRVVSIYVRARQLDPESTVEARMVATDERGRTVATDSRRFSSHGDWVRLEVGNSDDPAQITRVNLSGGSVDAAPTDDNFLYFDDLTFDAGDTTPVPDDTTDPEVRITEPDEGATITGDGPEARFDLSVRARDDTKLAEVRYFVTNESGANFTPSLNRICGAVGFPCPPGDEVFEETVSVTVPQAGEYTLRVKACDAAGNCADATTNVTVDFEPPEERPSIRTPLEVEITQGVQNELYTVPGTGATETERPDVPLLSNRTTVVRYYLMSEGGSREVSSAELDLTVFPHDGSPEHYSISANTQTDSVTVPEDPGTDEDREKLLWKMRANKSRTLNFVVPKHILTDAQRVDFELEGVTGNLQVEMSSPATLGITPVQLLGDKVSLPNATKMRAAYQHLHATYPVSDIRIPWWGARWKSVTRESGEYPFSWRFLPLGDTNKCGDVLNEVRTAYSGDTYPTRNAPDYNVILGVAGGGFKGTCVGKAYTSRPFGVTVDYNSTAGYVATHEMGHTLGLKHAGDDHGEPDGSYEEWPYPHGTISSAASRGIDDATFGVIANQTADVGPYGTWTLTVVDSCPTENLSKRLPSCTQPDGKRMHDFMSYGPATKPNTSTNIYPSGDAFLWASDITYSRLHSGIGVRDGALPSLAPPARTSGGAPLGAIRSTANQAAPRVEAQIIAGIVHENGSVSLTQPVMRKPLPRSMLTDQGGPFTLTLEDRDGTALVTQPFSADYTDSSEGFFWVAVPYQEDAERLAIARSGDTLFTKEASPNKPQVQVTSPNGGEVLASGDRTISWEASDPDGDPLKFLVQYSPDGGESWQGITMVGPGQGTSVTVNVSGPLPGQRGLVRVTASDGFNTAYDLSDGYFTLGSNANPDPGGPTTPTETPPQVPVETPPQVPDGIPPQVPVETPTPTETPH